MMNERNRKIIRAFSGLLVLCLLMSCSKAGTLMNRVLSFGGDKTDIYRDENMDFGAVQTLALMPLANMSREQMAAERVRDVLIPLLLSTGAFYVLPPGEVARGIAKVGISNPSTPSAEEVVNLGKLLRVDALITGAIREYGELRSGSTEANVISLGMQMIETQTGRIVWASSSTKGGISMKDRLLGGGGNPMNDITEKAIYDLIDKLFQQEKDHNERPAGGEREQPPAQGKGKGKK